ncbi:MAG: Helix-turn-helix domain [Verrucomicrobiota bacterium]|jgi:DNA-binding transcriptional ArsR family regulator
MEDSPGTVPPIPAATAVFQWRADTVFAMLADARRRRLLETLASGVARPASKLAGAAGRRLDATLKHLTALRESGLVIAQPDPQDGRRQLYSLSPNLTVRPVDGGQEIDFGCCVLRLGR